jgi:REP element-mobilizing transposase RayT
LPAHRILVDDGWMDQEPFPANKGAHRLRLGRRSLEHQVYHVTTATTDRAKRFLSLPAARCVVRTMMRIEHSKIADTWAFVVMPDHVHWLIQLGPQSTLSACVGSMKSQSAAQLRRITSVYGGIWQRGFHDHAIRRDEDLVAIAQYLIANPVRAGLVSEIGNYPNWDTVWL